MRIKRTVTLLCSLALTVLMSITTPWPAQAQHKSGQAARTAGKHPPAAGSTAKEPPQPEARLLARLSDQRITESSGIARGDATKGVLWTHNDSGDGPYLFAIDMKGVTLARFEIPGAKNVDWEDIANGPGESGGPAIYVGDIGDNSRNRSDL